MAELKLPSGGKNAFQQLNDSLAEVQRLLDTPLGDAAIDTHAAAAAMLADIRPRADVFERRARETDEDRKIYGPKMVQRVLDFCAALGAAEEHAAELDAALMPLREARSSVRAAEEAAAASQAAAEAEAARVAEAERVAAAQAAEEAAREAAAEEARRRAAAIAAPLFGKGGAPAAAPDADAPPEADELGRRPLVAGLDLGGALALLADSCAAAELAEALQALQLLCVNIVAHPEEATFRTIRLLNARFQATVARFAGGVEALLALGFVEREDVGEETALFYVMEEPSLEDDYERWAAWYEGVKAHRDALLAVMADKGVRPLPAATKGTGWSEDTRATPPARTEDPLTLHGQRGAGL